MTLTWDISTDFEDVCDAMETVTLRRRVPGPGAVSAFGLDALTDEEIAELTEADLLLLGETATPAGFHAATTPEPEELTKCLRRNVSHAEVAASNGKYLAGDTRWHLSANELTTRPRPGDTITDDGGNVYTILEVRQDTLDSRWRCVSRDLRVVHSLNDYVTIQTRTISIGTNGAAEDTWADYLQDIPARLQPNGVSSEVVNGVRRSDKRWLLYIADDVDLTEAHRVQDAAGTNYEYLGHSDNERIDLLQVVELREWRRG